jgi:hypothetical protein
VGVERGRRKGAGPRRGAPGALPAAGLGRRQLGRDHLVLLPAVVAAIAPAHAAAGCTARRSQPIGWAQSPHRP